MSEVRQWLTACQDIKSPARAAKSGQVNETLAVEQIWYGHNGHGSDDDRSVNKSQKATSVAMNRWLDEPLAQGPFIAIGDVVGWQTERADSKGGKKRSGHKGKNKKI